VLVFRVAAAAIQLVAVVAVGRALGAVVLGQYLVFQAVVRVGATALSWGHPWTVLRAVAVHDARGDREASRAALRAGLRSVAMASTVLAVAVAALALVVATWPPSQLDVDAAVVIVAGIALSAFAFSLVVANALKARDRQGTGLAVEFVPQPLGACVVAAVALATDLSPDMAVLGGAMAVSGVVAAAAGAWIWWRDDRRLAPAGPPRELALDDGRDDRGRTAFGLTNLANVVGANALPLLLPLVMPIADVGRVGAALRLTAIPGTIGSGLVSVYAPRFAREWTAGRRRRLARSLRETQVWSLALYAPFGIAFVAVPGLLVSLLGRDFEGTATAIRVLGIGQAVSAFAGTGVVFLSMCRQERFALAATTVAVVAGAGVALVGGSGWGISGASFGYAVVLAVTNAAALVWAHVGVLGRMPPEQSEEEAPAVSRP
jgi:O-antigen/teichoic acid export membrane protein